MFISGLIKNPLKVEISSYLKERGFSRKKLIDELIDRDIIDRSERVTDGDDENNKKPTYTVKYTVRGEKFRRKVKRMFSKHFEKNLPKKKEINEEDGGGGFAGSSDGGGGLAGATNCAGSSGAFVTKLNKKPITRKITESKKRNKKIYLTERQFISLTKKVKETSHHNGVGNFASDSPESIRLRTSDGKKDPSYHRG